MTLKGLLKGEARLDDPMSRHTTLGIGGPCDLWARPGSLQELQTIFSHCQREAIPLKVIGSGSNLLVKDGGYRGVVVDIARALSQLSMKNSCLEAGAGARWAQIHPFLIGEALSGLEFTMGIPGTVGGGLVTNCSAHGHDLAHAVSSITLLKAGGERETLPASAFSFSYRRSDVASQGLILTASFQLRPDEGEKIRNRLKEYLKKRLETQPLGEKSAGCIFKNPPAEPSAGALIESLGFKGTRVGEAQVSPIHANFIVNFGSATAKDFLSLIQAIKAKAMAERGITLEEEIEIIGED